MLLKKKKMPKYITNDIEISSNSEREDSDVEILTKKILMKKIKYRMCLFLYLINFELF